MRFISRKKIWCIKEGFQKEVVPERRSGPGKKKVKVLRGRKILEVGGDQRAERRQMLKDAQKP